MRLLCVLGIALAGCAAQSRNSDVQSRYADFVGPHVRDSLIQLQLLEVGTRAVVAGALVLVGAPPNRSVSTTDVYGLFVIPVEKRFRDENPTLRVLPPKGVGGTQVVTTPFAPAPIVYAEGSAVTEPEIEYELKTGYPDRALRAGAQGTVVLKLVIDEEGRVANATVLAGPGHGLDEAAHNAIFASMFRPAMKDGKAVWSTLVYKYTYMLR